MQHITGLLNRGTQTEQREFPLHLPGLSDSERNDLLRSATHGTYRPGECVQVEGENCRRIFFVLAGRLRVCKEGTNDREVTLYRIGAGETCPLTVSSLMQGTPYPAYIVCEEKASVLQLPATTYISWYRRSDGWRNYIAELLAGSTLALLSTLDLIALHSLENQIVLYLLRESEGGEKISRTHAAVASDLGLSREAVSRGLKRLERRGLIALTRGEILVLDRPALIRAGQYPIG